MAPKAVPLSSSIHSPKKATLIGFFTVDPLFTVVEAWRSRSSVQREMGTTQACRDVAARLAQQGDHFLGARGVISKDRKRDAHARHRAIQPVKNRHADTTHMVFKLFPVFTETLRL